MLSFRSNHSSETMEFESKCSLIKVTRNKPTQTQQAFGFNLQHRTTLNKPSPNIFFLNALLFQSTSDSEMSSSKMPKGLDLEISHHPLTMKHVVNLIIAMERLKAIGSESALSSEFRDEDLLNILLESAVEG